MFGRSRTMKRSVTPASRGSGRPGCPRRNPSPTGRARRSRGLGLKGGPASREGRIVTSSRATRRLPPISILRMGRPRPSPPRWAGCEFGAGRLCVAAAAALVWLPASPAPPSPAVVAGSEPASGAASVRRRRGRGVPRGLGRAVGAPGVPLGGMGGRGARGRRRLRRRTGGPRDGREREERAPRQRQREQRQRPHRGTAPGRARSPSPRRRRGARADGSGRGRSHRRRALGEGLRRRVQGSSVGIRATEVRSAAKGGRSTSVTHERPRFRTQFQQSRAASLA